MLSKWIKIFSIGLITLLSSSLVVGLIYEQLGRKSAWEENRPHGKTISINQTGIHTIIKGKRSQHPTIVFVAGYYPTGATSLIWEKIQEEVSLHTQTISYDRKGLLWSETPDNKDFSLTSTIEELRILINTTAPNQKIILVGHSLSGLLIRHFAELYPNMVDGLVLIDAPHPNQERIIPKKLLGETGYENYGIWNFLSNVGYLRSSFNYIYPGTDENASINTISNAFFPEKVNTILREKEIRRELFEKTLNQTSLDSLPLKIIFASGKKVQKEFKERSEGILFDNLWQELQRDMLSLSTNSELIVADNSGHYIPFEQPDLIINTIVNML